MKRQRVTKWVMGGILLCLCTLAPAQANGATPNTPVSLTYVIGR